MPRQQKLAIKAIEQLFSSQVKPVQNTDLAQYLLTHSYNGPSKTLSADLASKQGAETEEPGLLSKTFDLLGAPLYGTTNIINDTINAVKETNRENKDAGFAERMWNTVGEQTGEIAGSIAKNTVGTAARVGEDLLDVFGQTTGLSGVPGVEKVESGFGAVADKLTPRKLPDSVLEEQFGVTNKVGKYGGGFAASVALDPLTYVPGLNLLSVAKKAKDAKRVQQGYRSDEALAAAEKLDNAAAISQPATGVTPGSIPTPVMPQQLPASEMALGKNLIPQVDPSQITRPIKSSTNVLPNPVPVAEQFNLGGSDIAKAILASDTEAMKAARRIDNAKRAANARWGKPLDAHDIPDMTLADKADFADWFRDAKMAKKGIVSDGKGNVSNRAVTNVVEDIKNGILPRFGAQPVGAEGLAAERAIEVAKRSAKNLTKPSRKGRSSKELTPADQTNLFNSVYSEAARMVNEGYGAAPKRVLNPKQQAAASTLKTWMNDVQKSGRKVDKAQIEKELAAQVKAKSINKTDAKAILRDMFPPEPIRNKAATRYGKRATETLARQMLRTAEDDLIRQGVQPVFWNGMRVRLSDVLEEVGFENSMKYSKEIMEAFMNQSTKKLTDPAVAEAVNKALARRSLSMSDLLSSLSKKTLETKKELLDKYNYPVARRLLEDMPTQGREAAESIGATTGESLAMKNHIRSLIDSDRLPEERLFDSLGRETATALMEGRATSEQIRKGSVLINKMLKESPAQLAKDMTGVSAVGGFFSRLSTWTGRPEVIKRYSQDAFLFAEENAAGRTKLLRHMSKAYTPEQLNRGYNLARQPENLALVSKGLETDPQVLATANIFKNYFDWMLGSTGFDSLEDLAGVSAVRSSMIMTDVNKHLKAVGSKFTFSDTPKGGFKHTEDVISRDYSQKGLGWMRSWENANPVEYGQDPISLMHDIDLALQRTVAEYATFDEFARRFGAATGDAHFNPNIHKAIIPNPRLAGYKFHPDIQKEMLRLIDDLEQGAWMPSSPMMRNVIKGTRVWKSSVTIYRPVHHVRNVIGDAFNMWIAGHNNPTAFSRAIKVLESQKSRYGEALKSDSFDKLKGLIDSQALDQMSLLKPKSAGGAIIKKGGVTLDSEQLWASGYKRGLFLSYNKIEDLFGQTPMGNLMGTTPEKSVMRTLAAPFGGRAHAVATRVSEHREHFVRMAHYIAAVEKGLAKKGAKNIEKIYDDAAHEVRKYHPDGTDLTQFEQRVRVLIPFYAWTRKEIPLLMQAMVERPAKISAYPKAQRAVAGMSGIEVNDEEGYLDPFPDDQLFPDWIRAKGIGPIGDPESDNPVARFWAKFAQTQTGINGPEGYTNINPSNPFNDVTEQLMGFGDPQDTMRGVLNSMNPGIQIPASLAFDKTFSGAPISSKEGGEGVANYLLRQVPQIGEFSRLTGVARGDNETVEGKTKQNLINFFTAMGVLGTGPYQKSGEFEAKDRARLANK